MKVSINIIRERIMLRIFLSDIGSCIARYLFKLTAVNAYLIMLCSVGVNGVALYAYLPVSIYLNSASALTALCIGSIRMVSAYHI